MIAWQLHTMVNVCRLELPIYYYIDSPNLGSVHEYNYILNFILCLVWPLLCMRLHILNYITLVHGMPLYYSNSMQQVLNRVLFSKASRGGWLWLVTPTCTRAHTHAHTHTHTHAPHAHTTRILTHHTHTQCTHSCTPDSFLHKQIPQHPLPISTTARALFPHSPMHTHACTHRHTPPHASLQWYT